jgi:hypothetical protein
MSSVPEMAALSLAVLAAYTAAGFVLAVRLFTRAGRS